MTDEPQRKSLQREELWDLESRARREREIVTNPTWIQAYDNFIFACSILDAFIARSTVNTTYEEMERSAENPSAEPADPEPGCCGDECGCQHL